jgi:TonB family protein
MHPPQTENLLFRGIPPQANRGFGKLAASCCLHVIVIGLLAFATPAILINRPTNLRVYAPLFAPPQNGAIPKRVPPPVAVVTQPAPARVTREFIAPVQARPRIPKLEAAPDLATHHPELVLPAPLPVEPIQPPVQTGVFGSNATARPNPVLPITAARSAGFDAGIRQTPTTAFSATTSIGGFETRTAASRSSPGNARVQTGAFMSEARSGDASAPSTANVTRVGFDVRVEKPQSEKVDSAVRKTSFDELKAAAAPVYTAKTTDSTRPVEIIDKPHPAYTAEARAQKIEGDVLLDVIFTAGGEVRVLSVRRGLGHGLDENAIDAARHIRFHPATEGGKPVDQRAVLHIIFQITG